MTKDQGKWHWKVYMTFIFISINIFLILWRGSWYRGTSPTLFWQSDNNATSQVGWFLALITSALCYNMIGARIFNILFLVAISVQTVLSLWLFNHLVSAEYRLKGSFRFFLCYFSEYYPTEIIFLRCVCQCYFISLSSWLFPRAAFF